LGQKGDLKGDTVKVLSATRAANGLSVTLKTEPLQPVMQIAIKLDLEDEDGHEIIQEYYGTINRLPR
ncbi:MAG: hypothetical protein ACI97B_004182, partial [Verrucomicrobiales bacterium]